MLHGMTNEQGHCLVVKDDIAEKKFFCINMLGVMIIAALSISSHERLNKTESGCYMYLI